MEPEAYTIGWQPFLGLKIYLDSRPLIPRPETEWWTEQLISNVRRTTSYISFLDLCAGSGAIGCAALKYLPEAEVWFGEVDQAHEATIRKNIANINDGENSMIFHSPPAERAHVVIGDLFAPFPAHLRFDVIAANPPYVPDARELPAEVTNHEPALALRAGDDGLAVIRRIAAELPARLNPGGVAWVECDSGHAGAAAELFKAPGLSAEIVHDQYKRPRVIVVQYM